jgi:DNA-binding NtrC family response regulator
MHNYHILAIDDNEALLQTLKLILKKEFAVVGTVQHPNLVPAILAGGKVDAILLDMNFDKGRLDCEEGLYWLNAIKERPNPPAIILMTAFGDIDIAVRAMKQGADDFVTKPWDNRELIEKIVAAIEKRQNNTNQQKEEKEEKEEEETTSTLKEIEEERLRKVLKETGRNITKSAEILGISRRTLYNKIEKYGL